VSFDGLTEALLGLDSLRSCNAHPLATFAARKLLALLVGEPDRYAAGAFSFYFFQKKVFSIFPIDAIHIYWPWKKGEIRGFEEARRKFKEKGGGDSVQ
jgi:hypothetical protein